jgi:RNA-directed DNA polymerase
MAGVNHPQRRPLPDGHGRHACAIFNLVVPLAHEATAMRITETAGSVRNASGAVSALIGSRLRCGDIDCTKGRSTRRTLTTRGTRISTMATRTTTTRTTSSGLAPSADQNDAAFSFADLVEAYFDCRRTKRNTLSALAFEVQLERNLCALHDELRDGSYAPSPSICFVVTRPKPREVWAAAFRDRIVHHLLYRHVAPAFYAAFIADTCACIPGRGTLYAAVRLEAKVRSITQNWTQPAWYLKCDLANFFVGIDKTVLQRQLAARIREPWWQSLAELILFHDPRPTVILQSTLRVLARVPDHKRLANQDPMHGLPIGNLSSQFFANVYLDALDQYVKHQLRARHYIRYVDDFVLLHASPTWLSTAHDAIAAFLPREFGAQLNPSKTILQPVERGIDFVGQVIKPWRRSIRRRTVNEALSRVAGIDANDVFQSANSYFGLFGQASHSHHDRARLGNAVRRRGRSVNRAFTQTYRRAK